MEDMVLIFFISILTSLSSVLVVFFKVTSFTSWLILGLSILTTFVFKKIVISSGAISGVERSHHTHGMNDHEISPLPSVGRNDGAIKSYSLHLTLYTLLVVGIAFFYSRFQTTSSNPLVWAILPKWFLPALLGIIFLCVLIVIARTPHGAEDEAISGSAQHNEIASQSLAMKVWTKYKRYLYPIPYTLYPLIFLLLPILFPIGTDYDPFVHRAAEQTIISQGSITPRTILYSGEYGLVTVVSTITSLPIKSVNIFLLPFLMISLLPRMLKRTFGNISLTLLFLLPFSILTTTVPQGLGIFFLFILICLYWQNPENKENIALPFTLYPLLATASFVCHPFPGIAAFIFLGWLIVEHLNKTTKEKIHQREFVALGSFIARIMLIMLRITTLIVSAILIPVSLILNNKLDSQFAINALTLNPNAIETLKSLFLPDWIRYTDPLSFVHFFGKNYFLLFFAIILIGLIYKIKNSNNQYYSLLFTNYSLPFLFSFLSIFASSLIVLFYLQPNVTAGEHVQLFTRLFSISLVFLWPLFLDTVSRFTRHVSREYSTQASQFSISDFQFSIKQIFHWCIGALVIGFFIVSNIYLQFPYSDRFVNFKGYLTSNDDLETVQMIESKATKPYLVLANQSVGAAALDQFVFSQYVNVMDHGTRNPEGEQVPYGAGIEQKNQKTMSSSTAIEDPEIKNKQQKDLTELQTQYFYSIPISSRAHDYFLQMTKTPSQELVDEIFQTYEINELYLVLNEYWKISPQSKTLLSRLASSVKMGSDTIFKFNK